MTESFLVTVRNKLTVGFYHPGNTRQGQPCAVNSRVLPHSKLPDRVSLVSLTVGFYHTGNTRVSLVPLKVGFYHIGFYHIGSTRQGQPCAVNSRVLPHRKYQTESALCR